MRSLMDLMREQARLERLITLSSAGLDNRRRLTTELIAVKEEIKNYVYNGPTNTAPSNPRDDTQNKPAQ